MMLSTLAAYYAIELNAEFRNIQSENYISSMGQFVITFVVFCMSYIVAEIFFSVYDVATDSIMLCYCFDVEDGGGEAFAQKMGFELSQNKKRTMNMKRKTNWLLRMFALLKKAPKQMVMSNC